jgi:hypothetical protein
MSEDMFKTFNHQKSIDLLIKIQFSKKISLRKIRQIKEVHFNKYTLKASSIHSTPERMDLIFNQKVFHYDSFTFIRHAQRTFGTADKHTQCSAEPGAPCFRQARGFRTRQSGKLFPCRELVEPCK